MEKKIYKYQLGFTDVQIIDMPADAQILTVQVQNEVPCIWAMVNPGAPVMKRTIETIGTGHDVHITGRSYIGTYQLRSGALVFHVFELLN
jgi:hypothetical protein